MNYQMDFSKYNFGEYRRKSSEDEDRQVLSLEAQHEETIIFCKRYGVTKFADDYQESKSAKIENKRQEFNRMMKDIKEGKVDAIACWKLDRLARNMTEGGEIIDLLSSGTIKCIITNDRVWLPTDNCILMAVEFAGSKQYVKDLSTNVKRGHRAKASMGVPHGKSKIGFVNVPGRRGESYWAVDEENFEKVKKIFEKFLSGTMSANGLARYAREELGIRTELSKREGGKLVSTSYVHKMLKDPIYAGFFYLEGKRYELAPSLPRIITEVEYHRIQRMLSTKCKPKKEKHDGLFNGILTASDGKYIGLEKKFQLICDCKYKFSYVNKTECPKCNAKIINLNKPKYIEYTYYYNVYRRKNGLGAKIISEDDIKSEFVREVIEPLALDSEILSWAKEVTQRIEDEKKNESESKGGVDLEARLLSQLERIKRLLINGTLSEEDYISEKSDLGTKLAEIQSKKKVVDWRDKVHEVLNVGHAWSELQKKDVLLQKEAVMKLCLNLTWNEEKILINKEIWVEKLVNGLKRINTKIDEFEPKIKPSEIKDIQRKMALKSAIYPSLCGE